MRGEAAVVSGGGGESGGGAGGAIEESVLARPDIVDTAGELPGRVREVGGKERGVCVSRAERASPSRSKNAATVFFDRLVTLSRDGRAAGRGAHPLIERVWNVRADVDVVYGATSIRFLRRSRRRGAGVP